MDAAVVMSARQRRARRSESDVNLAAPNVGFRQTAAPKHAAHGGCRVVPPAAYTSGVRNLCSFATIA
jgi:hypothetical protein